MKLNEYLEKDLPEWDMVDRINERYEMGEVSYIEKNKYIKKLIALKMFEIEQYRLASKKLVAGLDKTILRLKDEIRKQSERFD